MLKSCSYCGKIHDSKYICKEKPKRKKEVTKADRFRWTRLWQKKREDIVNVNTKMYNYSNLLMHKIVHF